MQQIHNLGVYSAPTKQYRYRPGSKYTTRQYDYNQADLQPESIDPQPNSKYRPGSKSTTRQYCKSKPFRRFTTRQ